MPEFIVCASVGLLIYWVKRTHLLLTAPQEEIDDALETDLWRGRRLLLSLRTMLVPPNQFAF